MNNKETVIKNVAEAAQKILSIITYTFIVGFMLVAVSLLFILG